MGIIAWTVKKEASIMFLAVLFIASLAAANGESLSRATSTNYVVSTWTGDVEDAGTDSEVYIKLTGTIDKDNGGKGPMWYLEKVSVYDDIDWHVYNYYYNDWVDEMSVRLFAGN